MNIKLLSLMAAAIPSCASAFTPSKLPTQLPSLSTNKCPLHATDENDVVSIDVSDLGLTMADLQEKIPIHNFSIESSGYQSTSRIPDVEDNGCYWVENPDGYMDVTLRIPGLIRQPAESLSVLFSTTTISVTAFGRVVWSAIQMGISDVDDVMFLTEDGMDGAVIQLSIRKRDQDKRWGGFILQIGEDSIL